MNTSSSSGMGSLLSNTIPNPQEDLKVITTRSGVTLAGPSVSPFSSSSKEVDREPETITDQVLTGSTNNVPPLVVQLSPSSTSFSTISSPKMSEVTKHTKLHKKDDNLALKFVEIFRNLYFELSFADALLHMPKFASMFKSLLNKKEKLFDLAITLMNENCSVVILKKLPEEFGDPGKFLLPYDFSEFDECLALPDLGASINLMPLSIWKKLSLPKLTYTQMILDLADRSTTRPAGIPKDVFVKVGKFYFPTDFVVVDYVVDPRVPLTLGRPFLRTEHALIDVYDRELTLCVDDEAITFKVGQTSKYSYNDAESINRIDVIDIACEEYVQKGGDFILEEIEACLTSESILPGINDTDLDIEGDIRLLEELLNNDPSLSPLSPKELNVKEIKTIKSSINEPLELELKELPSHLECAYLEGTDKLSVIIAKDLKDDEKEALLNFLNLINMPLLGKSPTSRVLTLDFVHKILMKDDLKPTVQSQRQVNPKIHEMLERLAGNEFYCFLDGFSSYVQIPIDPQDQEKTTFTSPYGTFAYQRMPFGLCNAFRTFQRDSFSSCLSHLDTMLQRCKDTNLVLNWEKCHFMVKEGIVFGHKISKKGLEVDRAKVDVIAKLPYSTTVKECIDAFETLKKKLTKAPILVVPDWNLPFELMCDASDFAIGAVLGQLYAFEKFRQYLVLSKSILVYTDHSALKYLLNKQDAKPRLIRWVLLLQEFDIIIRDMKGTKNLTADHLSRLENPHKDELENKDINENFPLEILANDILKACHEGPTGGHHGANFTAKKVEAKALPTNDARVVVKILKSLFARFRTPRAIINDRGTYFCNEQFAKVKLKYGVTHRLSTGYHPQTSRQVEVSNRGLKRILKRTVCENRASWSEKLEDALWAFRSAYKTPIGCTPYKLVYGKSCHLPIELEHKAY
uniref:Reverse transcriptase domain-containing protein n=1 Tax=Tanacetum cinerariifolium TaxID=118510 RepID=A0A6L2KG47_TANCI|nr:reverse transcriptase domain-containing protein [Tanacetum cinerariifolium]